MFLERERNALNKKLQRTFKKAFDDDYINQWTVNDLEYHLEDIVETHLPTAINNGNNPPPTTENETSRTVAACSIDDDSWQTANNRRSHKKKT